MVRTQEGEAWGRADGRGGGERVSERPGVGRLGAVGEEGLERPRGTDVCVCVSDREGGG